MMHEPQKFSLILVLGIILIPIGIGMLLTGLEGERTVAQDLRVQPMHLYSSEISVSGGSPVHIEYSLSAGNMTVLLLSWDGYEEIRSTGASSPENVMVQAENVATGSLDWIASESGTYYLCFYDISEAADLSSHATYHGSILGLMILGASVCIAGAIIAIIGVLRDRVRSAHDLKSQENEPTDGRPPES